MAAGRARIVARWSGLSVGMASWALAVTALLKRRCGVRQARRACRRLALALTVQQVALAALLVRDRRIIPPPARGHVRPVEPGDCRLGLADALTLSRGAVAALLGGLTAVDERDGQGLVNWVGWSGLLWGVTASDWLDGAVARRWGGASRLGPLLDLEMDSWLTLSAALLAVRWGRVPLVCVLPPLARYLLLLVALRRGVYGRADLGRAWWARASGTAQMSVLVAGLAPMRWPGRAPALRAVAVPVACVQLVAAGVLTRRLPPGAGKRAAGAAGWRPGAEGPRRGIYGDAP